MIFRIAGLLMFFAIVFSAFTVPQKKKTDKTKLEIFYGDTNDKDQDTDAILKQLGIETEVDEEALVEKYPGVNLVADSKTGGIQLDFNNPEARNYSLDFYDEEGNIIVSFVNVFDNSIWVDGAYFDSGKYTYKLTGEGNTYAGIFEIAQKPTSL